MFNRYWLDTEGSLFESYVRANRDEFEYVLHRVEARGGNVLVADGITDGFHSTAHAALKALERVAADRGLILATLESGRFRRLA